MNSLSSLDGILAVQELLDRVENDEELLAELFLLFQEDMPGARVALQLAIEGCDLPGIERAAHRLKGMLANLSAKEAASLAAGIESAARAGDVSRVQQTMAAFAPLLVEISSALNLFASGAAS